MTDQPPPLLQFSFSVDDIHHRFSRETAQILPKLRKMLYITQLFLFLLEHTLKIFTLYLLSVHITTHTFITSTHILKWKHLMNPIFSRRFS